MFIVYFVFGVCALRHFGVQATLLVTFEEGTMDVIDPEYFDPNDTYIHIKEDDEYDQDENSVSTRITVIKRIPETSDGHLAVFGRSMGEFIKPSGIDVDMKLCEMIEEPLLMGRLLRSLGLGKKSCPVQPGIYDGESYALLAHNLPDEFEENTYQSKFQISVDGKIILSIKTIADVINVYEL